MTEYTEEKEGESSQAAKNKATGADTTDIQQPLKRTIHETTQTGPTINRSSNDNASTPAHTPREQEHNYADEPPTKKPKVTFINKISSRSKFIPESSPCKEVSSKSKLLPLKNDKALEKFDDKSSSADVNKSVNNSTKCESKISGIFKIDASINRVSIDEKFVVKDEKKFKEKIRVSCVKKERVVEKNPIEQFKFMLHAYNLKFKDNHKLTSLFKMPNASREFNDIYCFKKQINCKEYYFFFEVKHLYRESRINFKQLFSPEFDLRKYFSLFKSLKEKLVDGTIDELKIYCNRELNIGALQSNHLPIITPDGNLFKINVKQTDAKFRDKFLKCCVLPNLAKQILECINGKKLISRRFKLLKKYHVALINEEVVKVITTEENGSIIKIAKFHQKFMNNDDELSEPAKELRKHVIKKLPNGTDRMSSKMFCKVYDGFGDGDGNSILDLPHENCDDLLEKFFEVLQFEIINEDVNLTLKDTFGDAFTEIKDDHDLKLLQDELNLSLEENRNIDVFQSLKDTMSKNKITKKLENSIEAPKVNVEFEPQVFESFEECLRNFKSQAIVLYLSDYIHLSTLKIRQYMSRISKSGEKNLFICSKNFLEISDDVINILASDFIKVLVIRLDEISDKNLMETALTNLENSIGEGKRVIVVSDVNTSGESGYTFKQMCSENKLFALQIKSYGEVLDFENVYLHGRSLRLTDIVDDKKATELMKQPQILEDILYKKFIIGNDLVKPYGFGEKLFEIKLMQYVIIDKAVFHETTNDIFAICNINCEDFQQFIPCDRKYQICLYSDVMPYSKFILLSDKDDQELQFITLSERYSGNNVHLLNFECGNFAWKDTVGSIDILMKHRTSGANRNENERAYDVSNDKYKTTIISGRSGMGKSVCLYDLAQRLLDSNDPLWLLQLNLNEPLLKQYSADEDLNCNKFLTTMLDLDKSHELIFNMAMDGVHKIKIVLLIDGYDELKQERSISLVIKLLKQLQTSHVHKIYFASKSKTSRNLETALGTFSYSLKFSECEKENFLQKYQNIDSKKLLKKYAHLTNTPLHLRMLTELYQHTENRKSLNNVHDLYKEYVKLKLKNSELGSACEFSIRKFRGIQTLELPDSNVNTQFKLPEELVHETFTEYFAARWLFRKSYRCSKDQSLVFKCVKKLEEQASPVFINTYQSLFSPNSLRDDLFEAVKAGNLDEIKELLKDDCLVNVRDESGKCVLHHVQDDKTMKLLIGRKYIDVNATDFKRQTPLHLAVNKNLLKSVILLLKAGASYDLKDQYGHRPYGNKSDNNDTAKMLKMIEKLFKDILSRVPKIFVSKSPGVLADYLSKAEKMYGITPEIIVNVKDKKNNTLLDHAKKIKYLAIAQCLRKYGATGVDSKNKGNGGGKIERKKLEPEQKLDIEASIALPQNMLMERFRDLEIIYDNPNSMSDDTIRRFCGIFDHREISIEKVEENVIPEDSWLDDNSMDLFLRILKSSHPDVITQSTLYQYIEAEKAIEAVTDPSIQIIGGNCVNHWRCLHFHERSICIYDSKYSNSPDAKLSQVEDWYVSHRYPSVAKKDIVFKKLLIEQPDGDSCGVYAAAFAETLSSDGDPGSVRYSLDAREMRRHFMRIIEKGKTVPFPRSRS